MKTRTKHSIAITLLLARKLAVRLAAGAIAVAVAATALFATDGSFVSADSHTVMLSTSPNRSAAVALDGEAVAGDIYVFTSEESSTKRVEFYVDDQHVLTEGVKPFDLAGTAADMTAFPFDTTSLSDGFHNLTARVKLKSGPTLVIAADFTVANSGPSLSFAPGAVEFEVDSGEAASPVPIQLATTDSVPTDFLLSSDSPWLTAVEDTSTTPATVDVSVDSSGLVNGIYNGTVTATSSGGTHEAGVLDVSLNVEGYSLQVSVSADRSGAVPLEGFNAAGNIYVFPAPQTGTSRVDFYLDNATLSGSPRLIEKVAPFDFNGTASSGDAVAFDTELLTDGSHAVQARVYLSDGSTKIISASFLVSNGPAAFAFTPSTLERTVPEGGAAGPLIADLYATDGANADFTLDVLAAPSWLNVNVSGTSTPATVEVSVDAGELAPGIYTADIVASSPGSHADGLLTVSMIVDAQRGVWMSSEPDRSGAVPLDGAATAGNVYIFVPAGADINSVAFYLDDPTTSGPAFRTESAAPFDFSGTMSNGLAGAYDSTKLNEGPHSITALINLSGGGSETTTANFEADNVPEGMEGPCAPLTCPEAMVSLPYVLTFDGNAGGILDANDVGTGFTWLDKSSNGFGYAPSNITVDAVASELRIDTTAGIQFEASNNQRNALAVGVDVPSQVASFSTQLVDIPEIPGGFAQAGLWFGNDEDNYVKLVAVSDWDGYRVEMLMEIDGVMVSRHSTSIIPLSGGTLDLKLRVDPLARDIRGYYSLTGSEGVFFHVGTISPPGQLFSFDGARIDPNIGTDSFGGIFATHRNAATPLTFTFKYFQVVRDIGSTTTTETDSQFIRNSYTGMGQPTGMVWGPDNRLYVLGLSGQIRALTFDETWTVVDDELLDVDYVTETGAITSTRLAIGITVDPASTPENVVLWVSHSGWTSDLRNADAYSSKVSKISGYEGGAAVIAEDVITGLPRSAANHTLNSIHFGPDGRLYIASGGNTGAGAEGTDPTAEFGLRPEMPLSAALLVADVTAPGFNGDCTTSQLADIPDCDVDVYASGLRNMYDFVFHSNGQAYGPDNGLGVHSAVPPSTAPPCDGPGDIFPAAQADRLQRLVEDAYYGHPNPSRNECVFYDGFYQTVPPDPDFTPGMYIIGMNRSANGIVEHPGSPEFCGKMAGDLLIANYSVGDNILRLRLSPDGESVLGVSVIADGFDDPLPLAVSPEGVIFVGEFGGGQVTALVPLHSGCWSTGPLAPASVLDSGSAVLDEKLYMVAGKNASQHLKTVWVFNPATDTWSSVADLPGPAVENPAVAAHDGLLYVFGGSTDPFSGAVSNTAVFDPATGEWNTLAVMPTARGGATAQVLNGRIYVIGGMDSSGASLDTVEAYDPATDTWDTSVASMTTRRDNPAGAVLNDGVTDKIYVFGGRTRNSDGSEVNPTLDTVEVYDPAADAWSPAPSMPTGRRTMAVGLLNGRAQLIGGERTPSGDVFTANQEFDPVSGTWRVLTSIPTGRHGAAFGTIGDRVYVIAGGPAGGSSFTDVIEIFDFLETVNVPENAPAGLCFGMEPTIVGTAGDDVIEGSQFRDVIMGLGGDDTIFGHGGDDVICGGDGHDTITGGSGDDWIDGGPGNDVLRGNDGNDTLRGRDGDDTMSGNSGGDHMLGGLGNDTMNGGCGNDVVKGEEGEDWVAGGWCSTADVNWVSGGPGKDRVFGGLGDDFLWGGGGWDFLYGQDGNDTLFGNHGRDRIRGEAGDDQLSGGHGDDDLMGEEGDDDLDGGPDTDFCDGGPGTNTVVNCES